VTCALPVAPETVEGLRVTQGIPDGLTHVPAGPAATLKDKGCPVVVETVSVCVAAAALFVPPI